MRNKTIARCFFPFALIVPHYLEAASSCQQPVAKVVSVQGRVEIRSSGSSVWQSIHREDPLCYGDTVHTSKWSRVSIVRPTGSGFTLGQNGTLTVTAPQQNRQAVESTWYINLLRGIAFFRSRQVQHMNIQTPFINAVHKGTEFMVAVSDQNTEISVFDGQVLGENSAGKININKGFQGIAGTNRPPRLQALRITPEDAVQWALYYPPIIDAAPISRPPAESHLNPALSSYRQGNSFEALAKLENTPVSQQDSQYLTLKAGLLLTVGRVEEAQPLIQQAQQLEPNNSDAFALQAVIAVALNRQQAALELANKAVTANPQSPVAKIAHSYAHQAQFNIGEALKATQEAVRLAPGNALAWARLSELQLSQGDHGAALISAQKAQSLNPKVARTQTILGFADLARTDIDAAKQAFEQALALDSSDPLARLGLGLAKIRKGDVEAGKVELETAVNLDPNNAVIRSYLGKAYYELRNKDYAGKEYEIAKEMDSKDPTPWFYDAILKQTTNRPVEALHAMQKAIELNDNRGIYRSKLLLDSDSAARSASLGRIYNDLGFQQRGLLEGWNSINQDPSNYSAHRLLSDNYVALPRHEVARVSELLKAQLLQPVNITPVQPQAAESNILILDTLGSSITSFNEYNPLFTRDRFALQATGYYGSRDTMSDEVVHSGIWDKFSYSMGQFHYQTDGFRPYNRQEKNIYNFFAQAEITRDTNVQVELRRSEDKYRDVGQGFYVDNFSTEKHGDKDSDLIRGGLHHKFNANNDLLISILHKEEKANSLDDSQGVTIELSRKNIGTQYELQHIYQHNFFDLTGGVNYLINQTNNVGVFIPEPGINLNFKLDSKLEHSAYYLYSNIKFIPKFLITAGFSHDFYQEIPDNFLKKERNPLSPKFGLTWTPTKDTVFRFAAFQSLKRGIIQKQTLEPTQVAGFNQYFDDADGSIARRIGFGIDQKVNEKVLVGAEISKRYIDIPLADLTNNSITGTKWNEKNARAYVNWTPDNDLSIGLDYNYEKYNRNLEYTDFSEDNKSPNLFTELETHKGRLFGSYFHASGLISKLSLSYLNQTGNFLDGLGNPPVSDSSQAWLLDAEIGYRLPKRHGLLTLGMRNLFDEKYNYQGTDVNYPVLPQGRFLYSRITLSF